MKTQKNKTNNFNIFTLSRTSILGALLLFLLGCASSKPGSGDPRFLSSEHARRGDNQDDPNFSDGTIYSDESFYADETPPAESSEDMMAEDSETPQEEQANTEKPQDGTSQKSEKERAEDKRRLDEQRADSTPATQQPAAKETPTTTDAAAKDTPSDMSDAKADSAEGEEAIEEEQALEEPEIVPDFTMTIFKGQEVKVSLEGEGWIMANTDPSLEFLRKEFTLTGQSLFFMKANETGDFMLSFSRSAAVGIEEKHVLLQVTEEGAISGDSSASTQEKTPAKDAQTPATTQPEQPGTTAETGTAEQAATAPITPETGVTPEAVAPVAPEVSTPVAPTQPITPMPGVTPAPEAITPPPGPAVETVPEPVMPEPTAPTGPAGPGGTGAQPPVSEVQPPSVVRNLDDPILSPGTVAPGGVAPTQEPAPQPAQPVAPVETITKEKVASLSQSELKDLFESLASNPERMAEAAIAGDEFVERYPRDNVAAEVLYKMGQIFEKQGPSIDRRRAYEYYTRAYDNYPISPYSRMSKKRMDYLEQFYFRLP